MTSRVLSVTQLRLPICAVLAALLTAWFFSALSTLIDVPSQGILVPVSGIEFTPMKLPEEVAPKPRRVKPPIVKPVLPPVTQPIGIAEKKGAESGLEGLEAIGPGPGIGPYIGAPEGSEAGGPFGVPQLGPSQFSDSEPRAIVRVEPAYPAQAAARGVEGWVHVRYTVTTAGTVTDVVVVKSSHGMFERPAVAAALKWKYQPALREGKPIESQLDTIIRFEMSEEQG